MHLTELAGTLIYSIVGILVFILSYIIFEKLSPFSIKKEIMEDHNVALGIIMGAVFLGLSIIIASAMH